MELFDRYLLAVKFFLPRAGQADIVRELSEDFHARVEDMEAERGRPLSRAEQEELVKSYGHPALLAGRYGPRRRLIGPEIFPFYWVVLRLAFVVGIVVHVIVALAMLAGGHPDRALRQAFVILPVVAFIQFGIITLVFAMLDHYGAKALLGCQWHPRDLPGVIDGRHIRRAQPISQLVLSVVFSIWWFAALRSPYLVFGPAAAIFTFAAVWQSLYWPMVWLAFFEMAQQLIALIRPDWTRLRSYSRFALSIASVIILGVLIAAGDLVVLTDAAARVTGNDLRANEMLTSIVNLSILVSLAIAVLVVVVTEVVEICRWLRRDTHGKPVHA